MALTSSIVQAWAAQAVSQLSVASPWLQVARDRSSEVTGADRLHIGYPKAAVVGLFQDYTDLSVTDVVDAGTYMLVEQRAASRTNISTMDALRASYDLFGATAEDAARGLTKGDDGMNRFFQGCSRGLDTANTRFHNNSFVTTTNVKLLSTANADYDPNATAFQDKVAAALLEAAAFAAGEGWSPNRFCITSRNNFSALMQWALRKNIHLVAATTNDDALVNGVVNHLFGFRIFIDPEEPNGVSGTAHATGAADNMYLGMVGNGMNYASALQYATINDHPAQIGYLATLVNVYGVQQDNVNDKFYRIEHEAK